MCECPKLSNPFSNIIKEKMKTDASDMFDALTNGELAIPCSLLYLGRVDSSGKRTETIEQISLCVIWDYRRFFNVHKKTIGNPRDKIQVLSNLENTISRLQQADQLLIDGKRFVRDGDPTPWGYGNASHITTIFRAIN